MFRRFVALLLAGCLLLNASLVFAVEAPRPPLHRSDSVNISRTGDENPVMEIAKSVYWGALAGFVLGGAITLADSNHSNEPIRWGIVIGAFAGLGAGVYFVAHRPQPASLLELRGGTLTPNPEALNALEPVPGGVRVRAIGVTF